MNNPLNSLIDKASKEIAKEMIKSIQLPIPDIDLSKIKNDNQKERLKESINEFSSKSNDMMNEAIKDGSEFIEGLKSDLSDYGSSLGLLTVGTAQFSARIAMIPPAIISATPVGPGVSTNLITPMLQDLKAEGDQLSKVYDDSESKRKKLRLDSLSYIPLVGSIISIANPILSSSKPLILMVGSSVGEDSGSIPDVTPPITIENDPKDCLLFSPINGQFVGDELVGGEITAMNCSNFSRMIGDDDTPNCNNCKNFRK
jgi:hypothetical protein